MSEATEPAASEISEELQEKIERNRLAALERRKRRLVAHPYSKLSKKEESAPTLAAPVIATENHVLKVAGKKVIDTGGGFLIEENEDELFNEAAIAEFTHEPGALYPSERPKCEECNEIFDSSFLCDTFDYPVCNKCRDNEDKHALITKTDAMKEYLLKECDLNKREPPLKFIVRKNPHHVRWGEMKLYLQLQIEKRALEVWGSEEKIQEELEKREEKRVMTKTKKYQKEMKALRMNVRSSLYDKTSSASHTHTFGPEEFVEDDNYKHTCTSCGFEEVFEKM